MATRLLAQLDKKYGGSTKLAEECQAVLLNYDFPGNVRELRNGLERAVLMSSNGRITPGSLPPNWLVARGPGKMPSLEDIEREYIAEVLNRTRGKKTKAAEVLGISRKTLLEKRKKYGME